MPQDQGAGGAAVDRPAEAARSSPTSGRAGATEGRARGGFDERGSGRGGRFRGHAWGRRRGPRQESGAGESGAGENGQPLRETRSTSAGCTAEAASATKWTAARFISVYYDEHWGASHLLVRWFCGTALFGRYCMWALAANSQCGAPAGGEVQVCAHGERYRYRYTAGKCVKSSGASAGVNAALRLRRRAGAGRRGRHAHCRSHMPRWRPVRPMGLAGRG